MLAERRGGVGDLAVDDQIDQVLGLVLLDGAAEEAELAGRLLAALAEVTLVEREAQLAVLEDEVVARAVVPASVHGRRDHMWESSPPGWLNSDVAGGEFRRPSQARFRLWSQNPPTILIVEDHRATRRFLADNLAADGYEPLEADSRARRRCA